MKKLLFVLIAVIACSCAKDPRDEICGEYKYTSKTFYNYEMILKDTEYAIDGDRGTIENESELTITKVDGENSIVCIDLGEKPITYNVYAYVEKKNDKIYLTLYDGEVTGVKYSNVSFFNNTLRFTSTFKFNSGYKSFVKNGMTYIVTERRFSEKKYKAVKIKEQD